MNDAPNYITPAGFRRLNDELARLWRVERPPVVQTVAWAAGNGDRSENGDYIYGKQKLRQIDRRIRHLSKRLDSAMVVDNAGKRHERVYFGRPSRSQTRRATSGPSPSSASTSSIPATRASRGVRRWPLRS